MQRWTVVRYWLDGRLPPKANERGFLLRSSARRYAEHMRRRCLWLGATYEVRRIRT